MIALILGATPLVAGAQAQNLGRKDFVGLPRPYVETLVKGEAAFGTKDWVGATAAFQEATKLEPSRMIGFYRLGEAQRAAGKLDEAEASWQAALGKQGPDDLEAKVMFVVADLRERQGKWEAAKTAWQGYATFVNGTKGARGYPATATERIKQAERRIKDERDYGAVKERAAQREVEKAREAEENAKKDKLNR
ncbi:MAG: tetratricopeptide repeat protein [Polyangiaceae bacterium]